VPGSKKHRDIAWRLITGALIGIANIIPGISGGTIAVVTGIYEPLLSRISGFFTILGGWRRNLAYLVPVVMGVLLGALGFAHLIGALLDHYPEQTMFFFVGLILGSVPFLFRTAVRNGPHPAALSPFVITLALMLVMAAADRPPVGEPLRELSAAALTQVFGAGLVSAIAMIVPGVSGSFLLLLLGMYSTFVAAIRELNLGLLIAFLAGTASGIVAMAKLVTFVLRRFPAPSYAGILGLVLGSTATLWPGIASPLSAVASAGSAVLGFAAAYRLGAGHRPLSDTSDYSSDS